MSAFSNSGEWALRKAIIEIGKRMWTRGFAAANDGNITVKLNDSELLTTPTGVSKGFMTHDIIIKINFDGKLISPNNNYKPSSEVMMLLEEYKNRDDGGSVIHAYLPYCTSFAVSGISLDQCVLPEAILKLGAVPTAVYGTPSTDEIPASIKPHIENSDALLLANHGALTMGNDLLTAYYLMETLEHAAHIIHLAIQLGNVNVLPKDKVDQLLALKENYGLKGRAAPCSLNGGRQTISNKASINEIVQSVIEKLNLSDK